MFFSVEPFLNTLKLSKKSIKNDPELIHKMNCLLRNFDNRLSDFYMKHILRKKILNMCSFVVTILIIEHIQGEI
jgi:hypothetical protein